MRSDGTYSITSVQNSLSEAVEWEVYEFLFLGNNTWADLVCRVKQFYYCGKGHYIACSFSPPILFNLSPAVNSCLRRFCCYKVPISGIGE